MFRAIGKSSGVPGSLKAHRKQQLTERLAWGEAWTDTGLVFIDEGGSPIHPTRFLRAFQSAARAAGLRPIRVHDLRHSYASWLMASGVPMKVISERLRHAGIGITADLYTHMSEEVERAHAEAGAAFILGS
jgi:integrase